MNGATCIDSNDADSTYTCKCRSGCGGNNCGTCNCAYGGNYTCLNGGICSSGACVCSNGYSGSTCVTCELLEEYYMYLLVIF